MGTYRAEVQVIAVSNDVFIVEDQFEFRRKGEVGSRVQRKVNN